MKFNITRTLLFLSATLAFAFAIDKFLENPETTSKFQLAELDHTGQEFYLENKNALPYYKGRWVELSGELHNIVIEENGGVVLELRTKINDFNVRCVLKERLRGKQLDNMYLNNLLKVTGRYTVKGNSWVLEDCRLY